MRADNDRGVSVIVGTLLLILITVIAAAGLALMVSQMQKDEMKRQSHIAAVKNEKVEILAVVFELNQTAWQADGNNVVSSRNWSSVKITLINLNTEDVRINGVAVNNRYALNYTGLPLTGSAPGSGRQIYNFTHPLTIPGTRSRDIWLDFIANETANPDGIATYPGPQAFATNTPQTIRIITSMTNVFEKVLRPPTPAISIKTETEDLGVTQRDVLILDGSGSTADNAVVAWHWSIQDASATTPPGTCSDTDHLGAPVTLQGKVVRHSPATQGPLCIGLFVRDDVGMNVTAPMAVIPKNPRFQPASALTLAWSGADHILNATVTDMGGNRVAGQPVDYVITRNLDTNPFTLMFWYGSNGLTNDSGNVSYRVCGNGTVRVFSEKLAERYYSFADNAC